MTVGDADERACTALLHRYYSLIDAGQASQVVGLFTADAVWALGRTELTGVDALRTSFEQREAQRGRVTRHVLTNLEFAFDEPVASDRTGRARGYLTAYRHDQRDEGRTAPLRAPFMVGDVEVGLRADGVSWLVSEFRTTPVFVRRDDLADGPPR